MKVMQISSLDGLRGRGLRGDDFWTSLNMLWYRVEDVNRLNPEHFPLAGEYVAMRGSSSSTDYVTRDSAGRMVSSGNASPGLNIPPPGMGVHPPFAPVDWWGTQPEWVRWGILGGGVLLIAGGGYWAWKRWGKRGRR